MTLPGNAIKGVAPNLEPDLERREAFVLAHFETGNARKACAVAGVHYNTAMGWLREKWFEQQTKELKRALDKKMDGRITRLLARTMDILEDRLEKGDTKVFMTKEGEHRTQVPVGMKDLAIVTGVLFDKRTALRREPEPDDTAVNALDRIADKLRQYALTGNHDALRDTAVEDVEVRVVDNGDLV
jgi:predicted MPP superfamily phosphohydrolase